MRIIKQDQTQVFKNSDMMTSREYPFGDKDINAAVIELDGRYPEAGFVMNKVCKEIAYIIDGDGTLTTGGETHELHKGDTAFILPGEKYYFEGRLTMFMPCAPAWYAEQHVEVDA